MGVLIIIRYLMEKYIRMYDMIFYVLDSHLLPGIVLCQIFYKARYGMYLFITEAFYGF